MRVIEVIRLDNPQVDCIVCNNQNPNIWEVLVKGPTPVYICEDCLFTIHELEWGDI